MDHDRKFFDTFMLVLGALLGITILLFYIANALAESNLDVENRENPVAMRELEQRLAPLGQAVTDAAVGVAAAPAAPVAKPAAAPKVDGKAVYEQACIACHGAGIAGAPKLGDKAAWAARLAQGPAVLHDHALKGYQGKAGMMPPKGGRMDLGDDAIKAAVDYMAGASK